MCYPAAPRPRFVAVCLYGVAALVLLHCGQSMSAEVESMLVGPLLMLSAAVGALAGGLPIWMLPAPLAAAAALAMFYDTYSLRDYSLFVAGSLATGGRLPTAVAVNRVGSGWGNSGWVRWAEPSGAVDVDQVAQYCLAVP